MNLATFPIATLSTHAPKGVRSLKFQDAICGKDGKLVKRTWLIQGGSEVGLPTPADEDVYVALMELTQQQGFDNQKVLFSRYDLVKRLGWCPCGKCYTRLEESLLRLTNVSFHAQNAFWDNEAKAYVTAGFTLVQGYHIYNESVGRKTQRDQPNSWIMWSDQLHRSFKSGFLKFLDTQLYFSLQNALARRLYRYLDRKFGDDNRFTIELSTLAHEHLGLSRNFRYPSEIVRKLKPALDELVEKLYLETWEVNDRVIGFARSPNARREPFQVTDADLYQIVDLPLDTVRVVSEKKEPEERIEEQATRLIQMLVARGVAMREAKKLVQSHLAVPDKIELAVKYFDSLVAQRSHKIKNPGGFIVSLIRDGDFRSVAEESSPEEADSGLQDLLDEMAYHDFVEQEIDRFIALQPEGNFAVMVEAKKREFLASDKSSSYRRWKKEVFDEYATVFCRKDIATKLTLPDFEAWRRNRRAGDQEK